MITTQTSQAWKIFKKHCGFTILILKTFLLQAQPFALQVQVDNMPHDKIILEAIKGDQIFAVDSAAVVDGKVQFLFSEYVPSGMYRLNMGKTIFAQVMNEPPQCLDFIFNKENIKLKTDFRTPEDSLKIIQSEENRIWFRFLRNDKEFQEKLKYVSLELNHYQSKKDSLKATAKADEFNRLQNNRDIFISSLMAGNRDSWAVRLIKMYRLPFLDGKLSQQQRNAIFIEKYFDLPDFSDEALIHSSIYTERVFKYINSCFRPGLKRDQQEQELIKALDQIIKHCSQNEAVYEFILDYLVRGLKALKYDHLIEYIAENLMSTTCQSDKKTISERILGAQEMKPGTIVPDFILNDLNGDPFRLSDVVNKNTLIVFWDSSCPNCLRMIPELKKWIDQLNGKAPEVIAIELDTSAEIWQEQVFKLGMEGWYNVSDLKGWESPVVSAYNIFAKPTMFFVDRNLRILIKPINLNDLKNFVNLTKTH